MTRTIRTGVIVAAALAAACGGGGSDEKAPPPAAATDVAGEILGATEVLVTWTDNASSETGYLVERSADGGAFAPLGLELAPNSASLLDDGCAAGATYGYRVRALGAGGDALSATATVPFLVAVAPSGGTAAATSSTTIHLAWTNNATDAVSLTVYRSTDDVTYAPIASLADPSTSSWDDGGLSASTAYYYRVTATNLVGESPGFATATATTPAPPSVPPNAPPASFAAVAGSPAYGVAALSWTCAATNESGFKIWRQTSSTYAGGTATYTAATDATSLAATGLAGSTTYYFWIAATNAQGDSAVVGPATYTTTAAPPAAPSGLTAAAYPKVPTGVRFNWADNSTNELGFRIHTRAWTFRCGGLASWALVQDVGANTTTWTEPFTTVPPSGTQACFRVGAYNAVGTSYSAPIEWTMP